MKKILTALAAVMAVSGCTSAPVQDDVVSSPSDISSLAEFERLSIEMVHEMRLWAKAKEAASRDVLSDKQVQQRFFQSTHVPEGFDKKVTFNYYGNAVKAMEAIALSAGYQFEVRNGINKQNDPLVDIQLENDRLVEALYEVGLATGDTVEVKVLEATMDKGSKKIIYRYK